MYFKRKLLCSIISIVMFLTMTLNPAYAAENLNGTSENEAPWEREAPQIPAYDRNSSVLIVQDFLMNTMSLNRAASAGVIANMIIESGLRTTSLGDAGTSYGLCQWHNERWSRLKEFSSMNNRPMDDIGIQLQYFQNDLENRYTDLYYYLLGVSDDEQGAFDAAREMCIIYENPADAVAKAQDRGSAAVTVYNTVFEPLPYSAEELKIIYMLNVHLNAYEPPTLRYSSGIEMAENAVNQTVHATYSSISYGEDYWMVLNETNYNELFSDNTSLWMTPETLLEESQQFTGWKEDTSCEEVSEGLVLQEPDQHLVFPHSQEGTD